MGVEPDGMLFPIHRHCRVTGFSIWGLFFPHQMNDAAGLKQLLKPS
jgi:hypothetical protein